MKKIGLFGGTFDPPHLGHMIMADEVKDALALDEIWFIPTYIPPHKNNIAISAQHRINMLELAVDSRQGFKINPIEIERESTSYTIDTVKLLKQQYPDVQFYFIIGADMVEYLPKWHKIEELKKLITFVGISREGFELNDDVIVVESPKIDISSTMIREKIKHNKSFFYYVNSKVYKYIKEHQLYES